jgi:hypothetical protein
MEDLIEELKTKAGLTDEQAMKAVATIKDYIQGKVPPMFSGFVDSFFSGNSTPTEGDHFLL